MKITKLYMVIILDVSKPQMKPTKVIKPHVHKNKITGENFGVKPNFLKACRKPINPNQIATEITKACPA